MDSRTAASLEVDPKDVGDGAHVAERFGRRVTVAHERGAKTRLPGEVEDVVRPFGADHRLVVRRTEHPAAGGQRFVYQALRGNAGRMLFALAVTQRLRDSVIVAIGTAQVAAEHPEREGLRAGQQVKNRVGLDRAHVASRDVSVRHAQLSAVIGAHSARTMATFFDDAAMCTRRASHGRCRRPRIQLAASR